MEGVFLDRLLGHQESANEPALPGAGQCCRFQFHSYGGPYTRTDSKNGMHKYSVGGGFFGAGVDVSSTSTYETITKVTYSYQSGCATTRWLCGIGMDWTVSPIIYSSCQSG